MSLEPKTRKYRLSFRNKTRKKGLLPRDICNFSFVNQLQLNNNTKLNYKYPGSSINNMRSISPTTPIYTYGLVPLIAVKNKPDLLLSNLHPKNSNSHIQGCSALHKHTNKMALDRPSVKTFVDLPHAARILTAVSDIPGLVGSSIIGGALVSLEKRSGNLNFSGASTVDKVRYGGCGLYFTSTGTVTAKFIESSRLMVAKKLKKVGRFWIRICPDTPVTARSAETRMGRGKGAISHYEAKVCPGQMFMEFSGVPSDTFIQLFKALEKITPIPLATV